MTFLVHVGSTRSRGHAEERETDVPGVQDYLRNKQPGSESCSTFEA
jgi:hypothetical protein